MDVYFITLTDITNRKDKNRIIIWIEYIWNTPL